MAFTKMQPQDSRGSLISATNANYSAAINYYNQRRKQFEMILNQRSQSAIESFESQMFDRIEKVWNENVQKIMNGIFFGGRKSNMSGAQMQKMVEDKFSTSPYKQYLLQAVASGNILTYLTQMGNGFERFINDNLGHVIQTRGQEFVQQHAESLVALFTGDKVSKSASVIGQKSVRPDSIVTLSSITLNNVDGVYQSSTGLPVELQGELSVVSPEDATIAQDPELLREFLSQKGEFFGFSVKTWGAQTNHKAFRQSAPLQAGLNKIFNQIDSGGKRHAWEHDYTVTYIAYFLSHNIYHIVGPTNVAMVTRTGITWMDEFLKAHIFYMRVQMSKKHGKQVLKLDNRAFPQIVDSNVYVQAHGGSSTAIQSIAAKKRFQKSQGEFYSLKIKL